MWRMNTGVSGATALISSRVGRRFSANWCSVKPPTTRTHCGAGVIATCRLSIPIASARLRTPSQRSSRLKLRPPRMMWMWLSIKPGTTDLPMRSTMRLPLPASRSTSSERPTRVKRPSRMATALAVGLVRSRVVKRPLCRISSGVSVSVMAGLLGSMVCARLGAARAAPSAPRNRRRPGSEDDVMCCALRMKGSCAMPLSLRARRTWPWRRSRPGRRRRPPSWRCRW